MSNTAIIGSAFIFCAVVVGIREFLLRPENVRYPKASFGTRSALFAYMLVLVGIGMSALFSVASPHPWQSETPFVMMSLATATYNTWLLVSVLLQRFPARVHNAIARITALAKCKDEARSIKSIAPAILAAEGSTVISTGHEMGIAIMPWDPPASELTRVNRVLHGSGGDLPQGRPDPVYDRWRAMQDLTEG